MPEKIQHLWHYSLKCHIFSCCESSTNKETFSIKAMICKNDSNKWRSYMYVASNESGQGGDEWESE